MTTTMKQASVQGNSQRPSCRSSARSWSAFLATVVGGVLFLGSPQTASSAQQDALSSLSAGDFERQLDIPDSQNIDKNSPLMAKANETYAALPFDVGERMRFVITYLGVRAGVAESLVRPPIQWNGTWAHRVTGEVKNAEWYAWMLKLHDSVEGVFNASPAMLPLRFYINQQEPVSFRQSKIILFDNAEGKVKQRTKRKGRDEKREDFPLSTGTKDAFAALFYFRENVKIGEGKETIKVPIFTSEKTWTATATLLRQETIKVEGREYDTDAYQLYTHFGHLMEQKGDIKLWMTRDERRLPVAIEASVKFGYIKVALQEWDQGYADPRRKKIFPKIRTK